MFELPQAATPDPAQDGEPSAGPPESYTTCVPVFLKRVLSVSTTYQLNSGNISLKPALPFRSVLLKLEKLPSRNRILVATSVSPGSVSWRTPSPFWSKKVEV